MWFAFPKGAETIVVERQQFQAEAVDVNGANCFRAPSHFAPRILNIPGFALAAEIVDKTLTDLSETSSTEGQAIERLTKELEAKATELQTLREDYHKTRAETLALGKERDDLKTRLAAAEAKVSELEDLLEDHEPAAPKLATKGAK